MPDLLYLLHKWWKHILIVVILSLLAVGIMTFSKARQFLSTTTAIAASSYAADKASLFNDNIQQLYSSMGTADELDIIIGTAQLDTIYIAVAKQLNLSHHYEVEEEDASAVRKAAFVLKKNSRVAKTEYGALAIKVWDENKEMAPVLANALMQELQNIHRDIHSAGNLNILSGLRIAAEKIKLSADSAVQKTDVTTQLQAYNELISEYQLMVETKPPSLLIIERARPAMTPDRPRRMQIMIATLVLSLVFSILAAVALEKSSPATTK